MPGLPEKRVNEFWKFNAFFKRTTRFDLSNTNQALYEIMLEDLDVAGEGRYEELTKRLHFDSGVRLRNTADAATLATVLNLTAMDGYDGGFYYDAPRATGNRSMFFNLLDYGPGLVHFRGRCAGRTGSGSPSGS